MVERNILVLIEQTTRWRQAHRSAGRMIEAAACSIRLKALEECLAKVRREGGEPLASLSRTEVE